MFVPCGRIVQFCCHINCGIESSDVAFKTTLVGDLTLYSFAFNVNNRNASGGKLRACQNTGGFVPRPDTDGNGNQHGLTCLGAVVSNGQRQLMIQHIVLCFNCNAVSTDDMIVLEDIGSVQLQSGGNGADLSSIGCLHINVVNRTSLGGMVAIVVPSNGNQSIVGIAINGQRLGETGLVSLLITNHESDTVCAIVQVNIAQCHNSGGRLEACIAGNINAVNIDLSSGIVQTGSIAVSGSIRNGS